MFVMWQIDGRFQEQDLVHNHQEIQRHDSGGGAISHYFRWSILSKGQ